MATAAVDETLDELELPTNLPVSSANQIVLNETDFWVDPDGWTRMREPVAQGSYGEIYVLRNPDVDTEYVVKVIYGTKNDSESVASEVFHGLLAAGQLQSSSSELTENPIGPRIYDWGYRLIPGSMGDLMDPGDVDPFYKPKRYDDTRPSGGQQQRAETELEIYYGKPEAEITGVPSAKLTATRWYFIVQERLSTTWMDIYLRLLADSKRLPGVEAPPFASDWIGVLDVYHRLLKAGLAHSDLSMSNVMLDKDANYRIIDFGLTQFIPAEIRSNDVVMQRELLKVVQKWNDRQVGVFSAVRGEKWPMSVPFDYDAADDISDEDKQFFQTVEEGFFKREFPGLYNQM